MRFANDKLQINGSNYYQYLPGFFGKKGEIIFQTRYRQLFSNGTPGPSKYITIGRPNNSTKYFNDVFDSDRNWILPDDYGLLERNTNMHTGSNGMIIVHHIQDVLQKKEIPRAGVIDLKGQWVLLPKSQNIRMNENKQIEVMEPLTKLIKVISLPQE